MNEAVWWLNAPLSIFSLWRKVKCDGLYNYFSPAWPTTRHYVHLENVTVVVMALHPLPLINFLISWNDSWSETPLPLDSLLSLYLHIIPLFLSSTDILSSIILLLQFRFRYIYRSMNDLERNWSFHTFRVSSELSVSVIPSLFDPPYA